MNQRLDSTQQLIKTLTEELIHLKNELRQNTCIKPEQDLLPTLPLTTLEDYMQFEKNIAENEDMRKQLESLIGRVGGKNMASFIKMSIKSIITDEVAIDITWRGTPNKPSFQKFYLYNIIKEACHAQDPTSSDYVINKICQQHILHARDRVAKRNSKAILPD
ncbi:uncharacterized protein LOC101898075 [Musca domestica]|uniref:Uncharacterized protein LOC101898075 n=1 Tax=Musca domestica TaxID=7370 RepID=A0A1I8MDE8_MUSDO|nr:uncharacterized protein LOC101898075 [Musca domestica]